MRYVPLREAEPGMVLAADLYDSVGRTLIGCHCELTESYLEKLEAYGFDGIYIEDKLSEGITIESVITPQLRQEGQERIRACDIDGCKLIARRMVEAFSPECVKDTTSVEAECCGVAFEAKGCIVRKEGWRSVYGEDKEDTILPDWKEGDTLAMAGCSMSSGMTRPKPLHTESSLLAAMETAGREGVEDEEARQALKDCGIGTPATRAAIIETLLRREYMTRVKKSLVPTEKGLALYSIVKEMDIADVEMTGQWEAELAKIEKGKTAHEAFMRDIEAYTRKITTELLASDKIFGHKASGCACPKCGKGTMQFYGKVVRCDNPECALPVFRQIAGKTLTDGEMTDLLTEGKTGVLGGFKSRQGKPFSAAVAFDADFNTNFIFPEAKGARKGTNMKGKRK